MPRVRSLLAVGFLGHDVNIDCGGITKQPVDGGEVWKPPPASAYGPPKDHLRDVIFTNEFANTFDQLAARCLHHMSTEALCKTEVRGQALPFIRVQCFAQIDVKNVQLAAHCLSQARAASNEILTCGIGIDAYTYSLKHALRGLGAIFFEIGVEAAVDHLRDLAERQLTQCNQIAWPEEVRKSPFYTVHGVNFAPRHTLFQGLRRQVY